MTEFAPDRCTDCTAPCLAVAVVEDDPHLMRYYRTLIDNDPSMHFAGGATTLREGRALLQHFECGVLLCDLGLPDGEGIELVSLATETRPAIQVLVVTLFSDNDRVFGAIQAGAAGYLLKDALPPEFASTIREVARGGSPIDPHIARRLLRSFRVLPNAPTTPTTPPALDTLVRMTAREIEILDLAAKGLSFASIAKALNISPHTVTAHVRKIYQKLAVNSRAEAVYEARQIGIIGS